MTYTQTLKQHMALAKFTSLRINYRKVYFSVTTRRFFFWNIRAWFYRKLVRIIHIMPGSMFRSEFNKYRLIVSNNFAIFIVRFQWT